MTKRIKMVTRLGGETITVGECSPVQARILSRKKIAKFVDGKLLVSIRPFHMQAVVNSMADAKPDPNVSDAELGRRVDWFKTIMGAHTLAQLPHGSDLAHILRANKGLEGLKHLYALSEEEVAELSPSAKHFARTTMYKQSNRRVTPGVPMTEAEIDALFVDDDRHAVVDELVQEARLPPNRHRDPVEWLQEQAKDMKELPVAFNFTGCALSRGVSTYKPGEDPWDGVTYAELQQPPVVEVTTDMPDQS